MNNVFFTVAYSCRVYELGTNKEITDPDLVLDISMHTLIGDRDTPLHSIKAPDYCAIVKANKRGYLLVRSDLWLGSRIETETEQGKLGRLCVFQIPVQSVHCIPNVSQSISLLNILAPALAVQLIQPEQTQTFEYHQDPPQKLSGPVSGMKPIGHYRIIIQGSVRVTI